MERANICDESKRVLNSSILDLGGEWNCPGREMVEVCMSWSSKYGLEIESKDLGVSVERLKQKESV